MENNLSLGGSQPICYTCKYHHGLPHSGNWLTCAVHPHGPGENSCSDYEQSASIQEASYEQRQHRLAVYITWAFGVSIFDAKTAVLNSPLDPGTLRDRICSGELTLKGTSFVEAKRAEPLPDPQKIPAVQGLAMLKELLIRLITETHESF